LIGAELDRAEDLFHTGDSSEALALLARVVRRNPSHPVAGRDSASALWHGGFALPLPPPFFADGYVRRMQLLHDGRALLTCRTDGVATWDAASGRRLIEFENDGSRENETVLSPDERTLVAWKTAAGANICIFDVETGRLRVTPIQHKDWIHSIEVSPDSTSFITASNDKTARIYALQTGKAIGDPLTHPVGLWCAVFSPDARTVATCAGSIIRFWDSGTHLLRQELPPFEADLWRLRYSPDGQWLLAVSHKQSMRLFSAIDGQPVGLLMRHEDTIRSETFSTDGLSLLTASNDYTARLWSVPSGEPLAPPMRHRDAVTVACFNPDGTRIATCSVDHTARVWDTRTARPLTQPLHHFEQPRAAVFTPDGSRLLVSGADGIVQTWDLPATESGGSKKFSGTLAEFSADGRLAIAVAPAGQPFVWDASTAQSLPVVMPFKGVARRACLAPDARSAAVVSESGELAMVVLAGPARPSMVIADAKGITDVCFNVDGTRIAAASQRQTARVWNTATGEAVTPPLGHGAPVASVRFSPDGRTLLSATVSPAKFPAGLDAARLWDIATGQLLGKPMQHVDDVCAAEFSSDGKLVATASEDNNARIWDARTGEPVSPVLRHTRTVGTIAFSPDARRVVTSSWDGTARVWDAHSGAPLARPLRHDDYVLDARFSPDGRRIVTASRDKTVRLWDAETGRPLTEPLRHDAPVVQVRFHPDGQRVIASTADTARIWEVPDFSALQPGWLVELAEAISRPDLPSSAAATQDAIAQYERIRARATAVSGTDAYSQLARRLFSRSGATTRER
jgi:WD40 repeat protein